MDQGIYYNREAVKKLQKAIANADDVDWEKIINAEQYAIDASNSANQAEQSAAEAVAAIEVVEEYKREAETVARTTAEAVLDEKQDKLTAGSGISIVNNVISVTGGGGGGTSDYEQLSNQPQIAGITLVGNKSLDDLGIASNTALESLANIVGQVNTILQGV